MKITSPVFRDGEIVPKEYTCEGENINPPLEISEVKENAKSLALIVEDPDAPIGTWYHWFMYNIPTDTKKIERNSIPDGAVEGLANGGTKGYEGPCPPDRKSHRYIFRLYALDREIDVDNALDSLKFREKYKENFIEEAVLQGIYEGPAQRLKPL